MAQLNVIDRAIGYVSPRSALRRLAQRSAMEELRAYAGADRGRLKSSWSVRSTSADNEIAMSGRLLRDRMRDLVRNNSLAAHAVDLLVTHAIGDGIVPKFKDKKARKAFKRWAKKCDAAGELNFYGIQALAAREMFEAGDGLVRKVWTHYQPGKGVPLRLQVLEADQIDSTKDGNLGGKPNLVQGIELGDHDSKAAFWLFDRHPGNRLTGGAGLNQSNRVPASDVAHMLEKQRTQVRGVPWGSPVITDLHELDGYKGAERVRKRIEACMVGVMTGGDDDDMIGIQPAAGQEPGLYNTNGERVAKIEPGMIYNAVGGRSVTFTQPAASGDYKDYIETEEHWIAAGFRMPHFILTGRLDKVNYSSSKVGLEVFKRMISRLQWHTIIPMLLEPIIQWFLEAAYLAGEIASPDVEYEWVPPRFYSADPIKDLNAQKAEIRMGLKPWQDAVTERGEDPDEIVEKLAEDIKRFDDKGLVLDVDPRVMSMAGQSQQGPPDTPKKGEDDE